MHSAAGAPNGSVVERGDTFAHPPRPLRHTRGISDEAVS